MIRRILVLGFVMAGAVLFVAAPASAHVTVSSASATQGGYGKLTFRVPNEKATASTVALEVNLPADAPIASVSVKPVPGWTATVTKGPLAKPIKTDDGEITEGVLKIVWTAGPDAAIKPGQFQEFDLSAGPLPAVDQLVFKARQTYSDGEIVRWIEEPAVGAHADHPAPTLKLAKPAAADPVVPLAEDTDEGGSGLALALGLTGTVLGLSALIVALLRTPRSARS